MFRKDFNTPIDVDPGAKQVYKQMLQRARMRPDRLPDFQDITTVSKQWILGTETKQSVALYVRTHIDHALYISKLIRLDFMFI